MRACRPWQGDPIVASRRARYTAGSIEGRDVPNYTDEPGVDPSRNTETLAELIVEIENWRWAGVPFRLRSVRHLRIAVRRSRSRSNRCLICRPGYMEAIPDRLRLIMQPDRVSLEMNMNGPDDPFSLDRLGGRPQSGRLPAYARFWRACWTATRCSLSPG